MWDVGSVDRAILQQVGEAEFKADTGAVGSGGKVTLHFKAAGAGRTVLKLVYRRRWEQNVPPIQTFDVTVVSEP